MELSVREDAVEEKLSKGEGDDELLPGKEGSIQEASEALGESNVSGSVLSDIVQSMCGY